MRNAETITMTMRELDRLKVIQAVVELGLPVWRAAEKLSLSRRQKLNLDGNDNEIRRWSGNKGWGQSESGHHR